MIACGALIISGCLLPSALRSSVHYSAPRNKNAGMQIGAGGSGERDRAPPNSSGGCGIPHIINCF
jgi:hypothetical protein